MITVVIIGQTRVRSISGMHGTLDSTMTWVLIACLTMAIAAAVVLSEQCVLQNKYDLCQRGIELNNK